jgi:hypothetical protein
VTHQQIGDDAWEEWDGLEDDDDFLVPPRRTALASCRYCGCTVVSACVLDDGGRCAWFEKKGEFLVCSAPACVRAYLNDPEAP